jgi:hypothetical protein
MIIISVFNKYTIRYVHEDIINRRDFASLTAGARIANYNPKQSSNCGYGQVINVLVCFPLLTKVYQNILILKFTIHNM